MRSSSTLATTALVTTAVIWGSTFVVTKIALAQIPPFTLAFARFLLATLVLLPAFLGQSRRNGSSFSFPPVLAAFGATGVSLFYSLQNLSLMYTTATKVSLILAGVPAFTAALSAVVLGEQVGRLRTVGIALTMAGVAGVMGAYEGSLTSWLNLGNLLALGSALSWAVYTVLGKRYSARIHPVTATLGSTFWGLLFMVPLVLTEPAPNLVGLSKASWLSVIYLGTVASALPIFLWNYALNHVEASVAGLYTNLAPVVAVLSATVFLRESLVAQQVAGGAAVIAGVVIASRGEHTQGRSSVNF